MRGGKTSPSGCRRYCIHGEDLTEHLKSEDFFNVQRTPRARFTSTGIEGGGEGGATHTITGKLSLHGVEKSVTFPAAIAIVEGKVTVKAEFVINRQDFGIAYPGMADDLIEDDVLIKLNIEATRGSKAS